MGPRPPICLRLELVEERPGHKDRQAVAEAEQMCISGDETNVLGSRERNEVSSLSSGDRTGGGASGSGMTWSYGRGIGPSEWLRVVVHYEQGRGRIATAFARRAFP